MEFFIIENGQQVGPLTIAQLAEKKITAETLVWREGMPDWQPAWKVDELRYILGETKTVPPVPPVPPVTPNEQGYQASQPNQGGNQADLPKNPKRYLVCKVLGILFILLLIVMAVTNPSKDTHENAIRTEVSKAIDKSTSSGSNDIFSQGFRIVARMMAGSVLDSALDQLFEYHNYIFFSKGTITLDDKSHTVSYGLFGKVITMNADDMVKALEKDDTNVDDSPSDHQIKIDAPGDDSSDEETTSSESDDNSDDASSNIENKLKEKANQAVDKMVDKASKKVQDKIDKKLDEVSADTTTIEKLIDKILDLF